MDLLAMIASAVGGIVLWNLFFSTKKQTKCEAADLFKDSCTGGRMSDERIADYLQRIFGTADLARVWQVGKAYAGSRDSCTGGRMSDERIADHLQRAFGTADLDRVFKTFAPQTRKKIIEAQKSGPSR